LPAILPMKMSWLNRDGYQNSERKVRHRPRKGCFRGRAGSSVRLSAERESGECAPVAETAEVFPPNQVAGLGIFLAAPTGGARRIGLTHVFAALPAPAANDERNASRHGNARCADFGRRLDI